MPLVMQLDFDQDGRTGFGMGVVSINRPESLKHGKDRYKYVASFQVGEWNDGQPVTVEFTARYSDGALNLVSEAIRRLLKVYPELKAGRYGVPRNRAKCRKCGTVLWSQFKHDFTSCSCGKVTLDGGYDYRRVGGHMKDIEFLLEPWQKPAPKPKRRVRGIMELTMPKHLRGFNQDPRRG